MAIWTIPLVCASWCSIWREQRSAQYGFLPVFLASYCVSKINSGMRGLFALISQIGHKDKAHTSPAWLFSGIILDRKKQGEQTVLKTLRGYSEA